MMNQKGDLVGRGGETNVFGGRRLASNLGKGRVVDEEGWMVVGSVGDDEDEDGRAWLGRSGARMETGRGQSTDIFMRAILNCHLGRVRLWKVDQNDHASALSTSQRLCVSFCSPAQRGCST